ncbi:MAG: type III-B CRISPR-associated protein Cas10/Cmr2 [Bradymonadaceae bacterium]
MTNPIQFHFTMGPVQSFVGQSRRTRDLWAGSYLLSYLAEAAIKAVSELDGSTILLPAYKPNARSSGKSRHGAEHGTFPNRFIAEVTDLDTARRAGELATNAVRERWGQIADAVWTKFVEPVAETHGLETSQIWKRQVENFWDINWVAGDDDGSPLDRRKNWRTTPATIEPGDHCTMMGDLQELSGYVRSQNKSKQDQFWAALEDRVGTLDLAPDERLCAIALTKRLYPKADLEDFADFNPVQWPSTLYLAAVPWLSDIIEEPRRLQAGIDYAAALDEVAPHTHKSGERHELIKCLRHSHSKTNGLTSLDGNFFFDNALANENATPLGFHRGEEDREQDAREAIGKALKTLYKATDSRPSPFYALLLMDGDSMGKLISEAKQANNIGLVSEGQTTFTQAVPDVVDDHNGVTVYAGGDDVLAMVPVRDALACAIELSRKYPTSFDSALRKNATISGAIVYAHYAVPLRTVLTTAHHLLDDVAKDQTGRASLAVGVYKSSGLGCQWAAPWEHIIEGDSNIIDKLVDAFRGHDDDRQFTSGFFYNIRERFSLLTDSAMQAPGEFGDLIEGLSFVDVLCADYMRARERRDDGDMKKVTREEARKRVEDLLKVSQRVVRDGGVLHKPETNNTLGIDGALLVRFLAGEGKEIER